MADLFGPGFGKKVTKQYEQNGKQYVEFSDGRTLPVDSDEYRGLYSQGLLYGEDETGKTYLQGTNAHPEIQRYQELTDQYTLGQANYDSNFRGLTGKTNRAYGVTEESYLRDNPEFRESYDNRADKNYIKDFFQRNPEQENEDRGAYLDRVTRDLPKDLSSFIGNNLDGAHQTTYLQDFATGAINTVGSSLGVGDEKMMDLYDKTGFFSQMEMDSKRKDNSYGSGLSDRAGLLAPLSIIGKVGQSAYRDKYSIGDALSGKKNDAGIGEDILSDAVMTLGLNPFLKNAPTGARLIGEGLDEIGSVSRGYTKGLAQGYSKPSMVERMVKPTTNLSRADVKELREIQSLSSLSMEKSVGKDALYSKYLKSSLNDDMLRRMTGKNREEIQESLNTMMSEKKVVHGLYDEIDFPDASPFSNPSPFSNSLPSPPSELVINTQQMFRRNNSGAMVLGDDHASNTLRKEILSADAGVKHGEKLKTFLSRPPKDIGDFVPLAKSTENVTSLLPSLFKRSAQDASEVNRLMGRAFDEFRTGEKGVYNASNSISDSSAPLYYTGASRLGKEKNVEFLLDGFTPLNRHGFLKKAGVEDNTILDFMNNHISKLDYQGKTLPKSYIDKEGEIQIPNLLIKKFGLGGVAKFQDGGMFDDFASMFDEKVLEPVGESPIEGISGTIRKGEFLMNNKPIGNLVQFKNPDGTYELQNLEKEVINSYRQQGNPSQGQMNDFNIYDSDTGTDYGISQRAGTDDKGDFLDLGSDTLFDGQSLNQRVYLPNNFEEQRTLQSLYDETLFAPDSPMEARGENDFEEGKSFMKDFVGSDNYLNMLKPYYDDPKAEQKLRLERAKNVTGVIQSHRDMPENVMGYTNAPGERSDGFMTEESFRDYDDFEKTGYLKKDEVDKMSSRGVLVKQRDTILTDDSKVYLSNKQTGDASVHEISHNIKTVPKSQYKDIFNRVKRTGHANSLINMGDGKTFKTVDYLSEPTEVIARLDRFRQLMRDESIKNQIEDDSPLYNEQDLIKAFENPKIKGDFNVKQLIESTNNSQDLLWLMNNIVNNDTKEYKGFNFG